MGSRAKSGFVAEVNIATEGTLVDTGNLDDASWYEVNAIGASSGFPSYVVEGTVFQTPAASAASPITLGTGDEAIPLTFSKLCKTNFNIDSEYGVIEVTDDCSGGEIQNIIDGLVGSSGSLTGFVRYDKVTGKMKDESQALLNRFFDFVEDDGVGGYTFTEKSNPEIILDIRLNSDVTTVGQYEEHLILPVYLTSVSKAYELKGAQTRDFNWSSGETKAYHYRRKIVA